MSLIEKSATGVKFIPALLNSKLWIWLIALVVFVGWVSGLAFPFLAVLAVLAGVALVLSRDATPVLPILWMFYYIFSANDLNLDGQGLWLIALVAPLLGAVAHLIIYRKTLHAAGAVKGFTIAVFVASLAVALGGITMPDRNPIAVLAIVGLAVLIALGYAFMRATICGESAKKLIHYVATLIFAVGVLITLQVLIFYIRLGSVDAIVNCVKFKLHDIGWASANNFAPTLSICVPVTFYYSLRKSKFSFLYVLFGLFQYAIILSSACRGAILFTTIAMPFFLVYMLLKTKNRLQLVLLCCVLLVALSVLLSVFWDNLMSIYARMNALGLDDNGRMELYAIGVNNFKESPIFGVGFDHNLGGLKKNGYTPFWYHSTAVQILSDMGVFGVIAFLYFYYWRYRTMISKRNAVNLALFAGLLLFDLYGMIDVNFFPPNCYIIMLIMTLAAEKSLDDKRCLPPILTAVKRRMKNKKAA